MNPYDDTVDWDANTTADLQDIAAFDRLAGRQAPAKALQRYAHQRRTSMAGPRRVGGWQRLWAAARRLPGGQERLPEREQDRLDVSGVDPLGAKQNLRPFDTDVAARNVSAAHRAHRTAA